MGNQNIDPDEEALRKTLKELSQLYFKPESARKEKLGDDDEKLSPGITIAPIESKVSETTKFSRPSKSGATGRAWRIWKWLVFFIGVLAILWLIFGL